MKHTFGWVILVLMLAGLTLSACSGSVADARPAEAQPATVEHLEGRNPTRETLTEEAARRLDIQTAAVKDVMVNGMQVRAIPYSAIIYDTQGATWVYTSSEPLTYIREPIAVDDIQGDQAFVSDGPAAGSMVVTRGAEELYGAEFEFQEE